VKHLFVAIAISICFGCNKGDDFGEGVTREVTVGYYEGTANVRQEVYKRQLLPIKALGFYENGNMLYQTYYMPIDSFMMITTRTFYPTGALQSIYLSQAKIDTFTYTSIEGKVTRSIRFLRDYYIHIVRFYPNGKIEERFGLNNFDTARVIEEWYDSGIKKSEEIYRYTFSDLIKSVAWDSLGHRLLNENNADHKISKKGAP
jgi:antitoxin component YwqK of YwqJK toxin-antitoxin module